MQLLHWQDEIKNVGLHFPSWFTHDLGMHMEGTRNEFQVDIPAYTTEYMYQYEVSMQYIIIQAACKGGMYPC